MVLAREKIKEPAVEVCSGVDVHGPMSAESGQYIRCCHGVFRRIESGSGQWPERKPSPITYEDERCRHRLPFPAGWPEEDEEEVAETDLGQDVGESKVGEFFVVGSEQD